MPRADDGNRQLVLRDQGAAAKQHARRIVNLTQRRGITRVRLGENVNAVLRRQRQLGLRVDFRSRRRDPGRDLRANAVHALQFRGAGRQYRRGRPEPPEQILPMPRPHSRHQREPHRVDQFVGVQHFGHIGCLRRGGTFPMVPRPSSP